MPCSSESDRLVHPWCVCVSVIEMRGAAARVLRWGLSVVARRHTVARSDGAEGASTPVFPLANPQKRVSGLRVGKSGRERGLRLRELPAEKCEKRFFLHFLILN
jgi:hypothetical protein